MSFDNQKLYDLLPAIYRIRDSEHGGPLKEYLSIIAEQLGVLEENLEQFYDDQFIETCAEWVVPYIGDLIGYRTLYSENTKYLSRRAEVANTIAYRRRKGTATMLEQLALDVTAWPARVVEYFQLLGTTQYMNHIRPNHFYAPDLHDWETLEYLNTPFEDVAHTADVRRIAIGEGRYNIPNIGIFLWRLKAYSHTKTPAVKFADFRYLFSTLGNNTPLFTRPVAEEKITQLAGPLNLPIPISRRILDKYLEHYYGEDKSLYVWIDDSEIDVSKIKVCNLSDANGTDWLHGAKDSNVLIDPVLGRLSIGTNYGSDANVTVMFHYGFSADIGGGEYPRAHSFVSKSSPTHELSMASSIQDALDSNSDGIIEVGDSGRYMESLKISHVTKYLELRAANGSRPHILLSGEMTIEGSEDSEVVLNGLLISGNLLRVPKVDNGLRKLTLKHCTLLPGISLDLTGSPDQAATPSLIVESPDVLIVIEHCIVGALRVPSGAQVKISNSIVDATDMTHAAFADLDNISPGGELEVINCTIVGKVSSRLIALASNSIFWAGLDQNDVWKAPLIAKQKQSGCIRFSYIPDGARTPRRYRCQPELAIQKALTENTNLGSSEKSALADEIRARVRPEFGGLHYGQPDYAQLASYCVREIRNGADDESEMGVFHDLFQPQKEANLRIRLDEYLRFGLEAGIFYAS